MAGNHNTIKTNPFASLVTTLVDYFNQPAKRYNPFTALLVGNALVNATQRWGARLTNDGKYPTDGVPCNEAGNNVPCGPEVDSYATNIINAARQNNSLGDLTIYSQLVQKLKALGIDQPNAWVDFNTAVDYYFANVNIIEYFYGNDIKRSSDDPLCCDVKEGVPCRPCDRLFDYSIGAFRHPSRNNGAAFYIEDFVEGSEPTGSTTVITSGIVNNTLDQSGVQAPYVGIFSSATEITIFWFSYNNMIQPVVTLELGQVATYFEVTGLGGDAAVNNVVLEAAIIREGLFTVTTLNDTQIKVEAALGAGSLPSTKSDLANISMEGWVVNYLGNGTGTAYEFGFSYVNLSVANSTTLFGKAFTIYDLVGNAYTFYYSDGTTAAPEKCSDCPSCNPCVPDEYVSITAIDLSAVTTLAGLYAETYTTIAAIVPDVTYNSERGSIGSIEYNTIGVVNQPDPGTMLFGINYSWSPRIIASDGAVLATDVDSDEKYAEYWDTLRVPYEATLGLNYPYLGGALLASGTSGTFCERCIRRGGRCYNINGGVVCRTRSNQPDIILRLGVPTCDCGVNGKKWVTFYAGGQNPVSAMCMTCAVDSGAGVFRTVPYPYQLPLVDYNTPATIFNVPQGTIGQLGVNDID